MRKVMAVLALVAVGCAVGCAVGRAETANDAGRQAFERKDFRAAIVHFGEAVRQDPAVARYRYNHALALAKRGQLDHALIEVREALRIDPGYAKASNLLSQITRAIETRQADAFTTLPTEH